MRARYRRLRIPRQKAMKRPTRQIEQHQSLAYLGAAVVYSKEIPKINELPVPGVGMIRVEHHQNMLAQKMAQLFRWRREQGMFSLPRLPPELPIVIGARYAKKLHEESRSRHGSS